MAEAVYSGIPKHFQKPARCLLDALSNYSISYDTASHEAVVNGCKITGSDIGMILYLLTVPFSEKKVGGLDGGGILDVLVEMKKKQFPYHVIKNPPYRAYMQG